MKKAILAIISACVILVLCSGCTFAPRYVGERPYNYPAATWVSEEQNISFTVAKENVYEGYRGNNVMTGEIIFKGETYDCEVVFLPNSRIVFRTKSNSVLFVAECEFSPEKLVIEVIKKLDNFSEGEYKTLTFVRIPLDEPDDDDGTHLQDTDIA